MNNTKTGSMNENMSPLKKTTYYHKNNDDKHEQYKSRVNEWYASFIELSIKHCILLAILLSNYHSYLSMYILYIFCVISNDKNI